MQTLRKKTSPCKYRNDPGRFFGDGVTFKAKLIGILEVGEARGDRMCQEALQDLKMAIRAAGEHKQRITIHVTIDGLRLRDEKTGDSLYHHPVHKISFIAQDMTDSRAFGYIFGSPDSGHRFFGIKTDKAASQVVLAMRDLFQVVFELKKKEIEMARQQIQSKTIHEHQPLSITVKNSSNNDTINIACGKGTNDSGKSNAKEMSPESVADLVDLEQELSSIQRGITQMERITPSDTAPNSKNIVEEDPFGDSFTNFPTYNLLPPPESSSRSRHSKPIKPPDTSATATNADASSSLPSFVPPPPPPSSSSNQPTTSTNNMPSASSSLTSSNNWLEGDDVVSQFVETKKSIEPPAAASTASTTTTSQLSEGIQPQKTGEDLNQTQNNFTNDVATSQPSTTQNQYIDAFTDLDPLGTGKSKPYVDKKYFFQELKNPPKKVLKDLSGQEGSFTATFSTSSSSGVNDPNEIVDVFEKTANESSDRSKSKIDHQQQQQQQPKSAEFPTKHFNQSPNLFPTPTKPSANLNEKIFNIDLERNKLEESVIMLPRDTDPFSPTRKKSDPFQDGDIFSKLDPFEFEFPIKSTVLPDTKITTTDDPAKTKKDSVFNGPLQVNLPPESWSTAAMGQRRIERQTSESPNSTSRNRPSVFKQNTVDVISSISSKKMPHLFGQKFSKRDSNSINMRRLQESDSLSENETAPEPPPRPESTTHIEPPPLPPKKQFSDIVIRPRITSSSAIPPPIRYDYVTAKMKANQIGSDSVAPPIPLPSRRVGRTDSSFPGPGRPGRKPGEEEDYLTPINVRSDVPPLLPPPQTKGRGRRLDHIEQKSESEPSPTQKIAFQPEAIIPDITLSQLLTLGIDELAAKLNVPTTKLSTMTLVELTQYLSEFIENSKKKSSIGSIDETPVFKVNFDQNSDATFVAKFDDNFGEDANATFVANFPSFNEKLESVQQQPSSQPPPIVPPADRYAVLREIIEQDMMNENDDNRIGAGSEDDEETITSKDDTEESRNDENEEIPIQIPKIDTKITEAISHAKDRYAALRDIILVEDLFEKPPPPPPPPATQTLIDTESQSNICSLEEEKTIIEEDIENLDEKDISPKDDESSPESNQNFEDAQQQIDEMRDSQTIKKENKINGTFMHTLTVSSNKDDIEIDELMNRAISNLSLDSREHLSPNLGKSPLTNDNATASPTNLQQQNKSPVSAINQITNKSQFNDVSTSPIPLQKSPIPQQKSPLSKSPISKSPINKSPIPQSPAITNLIANSLNNSGSLSDVVCGSSPEADGIGAIEVTKMTPTTTAAVAASTESWAVFDKATEKIEVAKSRNKSKSSNKDVGESPCSSDGKDDWKGDNEYSRRWPKGHTSSSSRDLSPWDDETPDYKKRIPPGADRHGYYMRHARRMNSCDDDYEYEEGMPKRRERKLKSSMSRSRENFDAGEYDSQNWYQPGNHHNWSPPDDEDRTRPFDRSSYERSTYGPPFDKRDHKIPMHASYDRRDHKRKYYREYARPEYDFETYGESPDTKDRKILYYGDSFEKQKCRQDYDYEDVFARDGRIYKAREYFYERDRKSFDRDSVESYESAGRRHKSFGSGDVYGSLDSREEFRERYLNVEKSRSLRKGMKIRPGGGNDDYEQDSETDIQMRRGPGDTKSLQRPPQTARIRKSSGSSPWDGEELPPPSAPGQKIWKRPSSASESERRLAERRVLCHTLSGSDGEKDRRFRKKPRPRGKEMDVRQQNIPIPPRYAPPPPSHRADSAYDYMNYDDYEQPMDEDKFERLNRRRHDMHQRMMEAERRRKGANDKYSYDEEENEMGSGGGSKYLARKERFFSEKERYSAHKFDAFDDPKSMRTSSVGGGRCEFDFEDFEETPGSNTSSNKFNFEEHGFESDFNSPPPAPPIAGSTTTITTTTAAATKSSYRFSNDFSDKDKQQQSTANVSSFDTDYSQTPTQKLRFDDKVTISKFDNDQPSAFEDDFSKAEFDFENEDQWNPDHMKKSNNIVTGKGITAAAKRQENIRKSESVNIFARKSEDPFEDDDFFKTTTTGAIKSPTSQNDKKNHEDELTPATFQWDNNFAKFDENM